ncbi:DUF2231 domain-containing protein [Altericroceibacterium xinjiangense]|uniref:DUF2231 domain-containing protein n=1 Tax=Altericroceibacterium xinjiangense TaxID=762261 RepID=UPI001F4996CE|nr:DUF2231 domain-containing protein [Altericroceibacterium xinjiangense]
MRDGIDREYCRAIHPVHAVLIASTIPLFLGAVLSNWAYASTYQIQWTNFASWLVAGGLVFTGLALAWAVIALLRGRRSRRGWIYAGLVALTFISGFMTSLVLAKDAWAAMPAALILSIVTFVLAVAANWAAHSSRVLGDET